MLIQATQLGIRAASQKYRIPISKINIWNRSFSKIKHARGRKPIDPYMEQKVCEWLKNQLDKGTVLTQKAIRDKAKKISCSNEFKASKGWLQKFFKRRPELFNAYSTNRKTNNENVGFDQQCSHTLIKK